jgi:hypothetical protein
MFSGKSAIDLKNLDAESLSTIKSHYNLFESTEPEQLKKKPASFTDKQWYDYILGTKADLSTLGSYTQCYGGGDRHTTVFLAQAHVADCDDRQYQQRAVEELLQ